MMGTCTTFVLSSASLKVKAGMSVKITAGELAKKMAFLIPAGGGDFMPCHSFKRKLYIKAKVTDVL